MKTSLRLITLTLLQYCFSDDVCRDSVCHFELSLNYRYTMSCMDDTGSHSNGPGWFPIETNKDRRPYLTENTFYYKNETRFFDSSRCIFGKGGKSGVVEINNHYPAPP